MSHSPNSNTLAIISKRDSIILIIKITTHILHANHVEHATWGISIHQEKLTAL